MNYKQTYYERKLMKKNKIFELKPFQGGVNLIFKVLKKGYVRKIRKNDSLVSECLIGDDTGTILLTVWDEDIEMLESGEYYSISNGFVNIHRGNLKLNKKRNGEIEPFPSQDYEINSQNNLSKEKYDEAMTILKTEDVSSKVLSHGININQDNIKIKI